MKTSKKTILEFDLGFCIMQILQAHSESNIVLNQKFAIAVMIFEAIFQCLGSSLSARD